MALDTDYVVNASGHRIYVDAQDPRAEVLRARSGDLNPHSLRLWRHLLASNRWDLVIDIGANYGEMLLGAPLPNAATVIAFEPNELVADHLERSLREASLPVDVRRVAVSDTPGVHTFLRDDGWSGTSRLVFDDQPGSPVRQPSALTVPTTTLDDVISPLGARRACIKIDVEGAEDRVLAGGEIALQGLVEVAIHIEILHCAPEQIAAWTDAWSVYLYDVRTEVLIRVDGGQVDQLAALLDQPWVYRQDAVLRRVQRT